MYAYHRLSIFVFRRRAASFDYLLVRPRPAREFGWSPISAPLNPEDTLRTGTERPLRDEWEAPAASPWIDLDLCARWEMGGTHLIHWCVGYGVAADWEPLREPESVDQVRWELFADGYRLLEDPQARQALFRLHVHSLAG